MSDNNNSLFNQSLEKGLAVLRAFNARQRTMNLAEVAEAAGINKSSAQRMIHTSRSSATCASTRRPSASSSRPG